MAKGEEHRKDVTISTPAAVWPPPKPRLTGLTPQDEIAYLRGELRRTDAELQEQKMTAEALCQTAVCLIRAVQILTGSSFDAPVEIASELFNRMYDTRIHVRVDVDGTLFCSYTDRTNDLFAVEGRTT